MHVWIASPAATITFTITTCLMTGCSTIHDREHSALAARCNATTLTMQQVEQIALSQLGPESRQALISPTARPLKDYWLVLMTPKESRSFGDDWFELIDFCGKPIGSMASH